MTDHPELVIHGGVLQLTPTPETVWRPHRQIPLTGRSLTPRPRLITQLESAIQTSRIVVVCGEAGAGKTSLVACWAGQVGSGTVVDWRTLDGSDLVELLGQPLIDEPGLVDTSLRSPQDRRVVVVVDDFPVEPDRAACAALELFLERTGPQVGVVLISLGSPRLDTQRLGLGADRLAIDSAELAMNRTEIAAVLARQAVTPEPALVEGIWQRTQGWAWAVRVAAVGSARSASIADQLRVVDLAVSDYLETSALCDLTAAEVSLLTATSMVEHVGAGLAYQIGGGLDTSATQRSRGFARTHADGSFTLHPVLRRHLLQQLRRDLPTARAATRRVASFLADRGELDAAVAVAVNGSDWPWAAQALVDDLRVLRLLGSTDPLLERPEALDGIGAVEPTLLAADALRRCWPDLAARALESTADSSLDQPTTVSAQLSDAVLRMALARWQADPASGLGWHRRALALLPRLSVTQRTAHPELVPLLHAHLAAFEATGDAHEHVKTSLERGARSFRSKGVHRGDPSVRTAAADCLGQLAWWRARAGELTDAARHAADLLGDPHPPASRVGHDYARLAAVWCQLSRGDVERATELFAARARSSAPADGAVLPELLAARELTAARLAAMGAPVVAGRPSATTPYEHEWQLIRAEAELDAGSPAAALAILGESTPNTTDAQVLRARAAIQLGDVAGAAAAMRRRPVAAVTLQCEVQLGLIEAWLAAERQDRARERALVDRALRTAGREQLRAPLGWAKPWLHDVVTAEPELVRHHGHFLASVHGPSGDPGGTGSMPGPISPLTGRELDILQRLGALRTNDEIAADLYLSANTIKSHLKSLYRKLEVTRRSEAFRRGRALGLC